MGREDLARKAEQLAAWVRFDLDEPQAAQRFHSAAAGLRGLSQPRLLFGKALEGALSLGAADRGNIQLVNPATGSLVIVAEHGFGAEFLEYFAVVDDDRSACGRAAKRHTQTVIFDVATDPGFAPHRAIAAASGFRAVQSTPLIDRAGRLVGVISTHYRRPYFPSARERQVMKRYAELVGHSISDHPSARPDGRANGAVAAFSSAARGHEHAAEAHETSIRTGAGDAAEHQRRAVFHRAAAEADRRRAEEAESLVVDPLPAGLMSGRRQGTGLPS
jgi:GAF domain-containing protein